MLPRKESGPHTRRLPHFAISLEACIHRRRKNGWAQETQRSSVGYWILGYFVLFTFPLFRNRTIVWTIFSSWSSHRRRRAPPGWRTRSLKSVIGPKSAVSEHSARTGVSTEKLLQKTNKNYFLRFTGVSCVIRSTWSIIWSTYNSSDTVT